MKRKGIKIFVLFALFAFLGNSAFCQVDKNKVQKIKKSKFEKRPFEKAAANDSPAPVGPPTGEGPISGGLSFLLIGSAVYLIRKAYNENK